MPGIGDHFTLLVPTFNRPVDLARLLRYLGRHSAAFPVLVLDSGDDESRAATTSLVAGSDLNVRVLAYESLITPFEKFLRGSEEVKTEFCALCADDDVVMLESLPPLVEFLQQHPDFSAAHGWYFTFDSGRHLDVTALVYSGRSLDRPDPLRRLRDLFDRYEAVTYALYRTHVMRDVLRGVQPLATVLARELLAGALTVVAGKVGRLPLFYYGRSLRPSEPSERWHPLQFLISSPEELFGQYGEYRERLLEAFGRTGYRSCGATELRGVIDLIHLRYLSEYATPELLNYLIEERIAGTSRQDILQGAWPRLAPSTSRVVNGLRYSRRLRRIRDRFAPAFRLRHVSRLLGLAEDRTVTATTAAGQPRTYRLNADFLSALARADRPLVSDPVGGLIRALNAYE